MRSSVTTMRRTLHILVAALAVDAFAPPPASVRRRQPLYSKLPKRLRTSDLDAEGRCEEAGIVVKASPGKGFGAFAAKADEDITIADYVGEQLTQAEVDVRYKVEDGLEGQALAEVAAIERYIGHRATIYLGRGRSLRRRRGPGFRELVPLHQPLL